jgi:hypothetical protein
MQSNFSKPSGKPLILLQSRASLGSAKPYNILQSEPVSVPIPGRSIVGSIGCRPIQPNEINFAALVAKTKKDVWEGLINVCGDTG